MAGIYIHGLKIPNGGTIKIEIGYDADGHPMAMTEDYNVYDVIAVPDHGRLVDADALEAKGYCLSKLNIDYDAPRGSTVWRECVPFDEAPTIIPAEEGE